MNKIVKIFNGSKALKVVKIDTETAQILKKGETNEFAIDGGLKGVFSKENQNVGVMVCDINIIRNGDFSSVVNGVLNIQLNKSQTKEINKNGVLNGVSFVDVQNVLFDLKLVNNKIEFTNDLQTLNLAYYTENNTRI